MQRRVVVSAVIRNNKKQILLGKKPKDHGVYPGQWGIPGGGIEENETLEQALKREIKEETGLSIKDVEPLVFNAYKVTKKFRNRPSIKMYMIALTYKCNMSGGKVTPNDEFEQLKWVDEKDLKEYDLNHATKWLFGKMKIG